MLGPDLLKKNREQREAAEQMVLAALLSASPGGLTISEIMGVTGLSERRARNRIHELRAQNRVRVCDYRELRNVNVEAWGLGSAPSLTLNEWIAKRAETDVEQAMLADIQRNHACWMAKWKAHRDAAAAWI
ncbi:hypothetical protein [Ralstonia sp. CP]|uniref:hypothetical protein n=1 Tax=Ralstonia sp. CP TaxID=3231757 RepID=UPI00345C2244